VFGRRFGFWRPESAEKLNQTGGIVARRPARARSRHQDKASDIVIREWHGIGMHRKRRLNAPCARSVLDAVA
jgi:hypothetical protein